MPTSKHVITVTGKVEEALPAMQYRVTLESGKTILAHLAGKMRLYRIRVVPGDAVIVEMPDEKSERGRIVRRL